MISKKYKIEDKIRICYKDKEEEFIPIGLRMTLNDVREDICEKNRNGKIENYLYIEIKNNKKSIKEHSKGEDEEENENDDNEEENENEDEKLSIIKEEEEFFNNSNQKNRFLSVQFLSKFKKERIGHGATSEIFKIYYAKYPNKKYAMKVIYPDLIKDDKYFDESNQEEAGNSLSIDFNKFKRFSLEFEVMNKIEHQNIIKAYGFCLGDETHPPCIVLEYCPSNLKNSIKNLSHEERIQIIIEVSDGMKMIHKLGLIHRDLKPENILLDFNKHAKISDFGIYTFIKVETETLNRTQFTNTTKFMAPEILNENKQYDEKVDGYSFGVVIYYIMTGGEYPDIRFVDVAKGKQAPIPKTINPLLIELMQKCWIFEPKNRPTFEYINKYLNTNKNNLISKH